MSDDEDFDAIIIASAKADSGAEGEDDPGLTAILAAAAEAGPPEPRPKQKFVGGDDDLLEATQGMGLKTQSQVESDGKGLFKPWMKFHKFNLVKTVDEVRELVDAALAHGRCALDLECEGLDNRIDYDSAGNPHTKHKIVGYCIGLKGAGYYIPVRHKFDAFVGETNPNVPVDAVDVEIRRLCLASQPKLTEEGLEDDPYGSNKWAEPPKVVLYFWNSKFDQEFLYPVTGIDFWHPDSYEDGMLAAYAIFSDDEVGLKPQAEKRLRVADPELKDGTGKPVSYPYQMIEFKELFRRGTPEDEMRIADLYPDADSDVVRYGCSDGICTELMCEAKRVRWQYAVMPGGFSYKHCVAEALEKHGFTYRIEKQASQAVRVLERARVQIDKEELEKLRAEAEAELTQYEQKIVSFANARGFKDLNPGSPQALSDFLFTEKGLNLEPKPEKTSEGSDQYKTDATTLEKLWEALPDVEVLSWVVKFRQIDRIIGTYLTGLISNCDANQCLRFNFNQTGAATGRFTAPAGKPSHGYSGIPIQGIPGRDDPKKPKVAHSLRRMFKPRPGYAFAKIDYSGQELRIVTNISREPLWLKEFQEKGADADLHTLTAQAFFGAHVTKDHKLERGMGKCVHPDTLIFDGAHWSPIGDRQFPDQAETFGSGVGQVYDGAELRQVSAHFNGGIKPMCHVVLTGGLVTCSENHLFKLEDGEFVRAIDLQPHMVLATPAIVEIRDSKYPALPINLWEGIPTTNLAPTDDLAYFAGLFLGDGTTTLSSAALTHGEPDKLDHFGNPYEDWIRHLEAACARCGFTTTRKDAGSLYLGSRVFSRLLQHLGLRGPKKKKLRVPTWVLQGGRTSILQFLGGLFDTDGTVGKGAVLDLTTKDFVFAGQLAALLRSCGYDFHVDLTFNQKYQRYYARLRLTVESSWKMVSYIRHPGKRARLRPAQHTSTQTVNRFLVQKVLPAGVGQVVDISVEDSHIYLANGFVTHNTANFALIYGGGTAAVQRATKCDKVEAARRKDNFDKSVPTFAKWVKEQHKTVKVKRGITNAFRRFIAIPDANLQIGDLVNGKPVTDERDVRKIRAGCERKSTNYPIQSAGADVMKISLIMLVKELHRRGWLRNGGDDSVRMVLTVHDEIVFEIRLDRLLEAIPLIKQLMESPAKLVRWDIPLVAEVLLGQTWDAKYNWDELMSGKKPIPEWLSAYLKPGAEVHPTVREVLPAKPQQVEFADDEEVGADLPANSAPVSSPATPPAQPISRPAGARIPIATFRLPDMFLTRDSIRLVLLAISGSPSSPESQASLRLTDVTGNVLIDPGKFVVDPQRFARELRDRNLGGTGQWEVED